MIRDCYPGLERICDSTVLWKYFHVSRFVEVLKTKQIYLRRADRFDDPLEGRSTRATAENTLKEFGGDPTVTIPFLLIADHIATRAYVSCLCESEDETSWMWKQYADDYRGVAIQTTAGALRSAFIGGEDSVLAKVQYVSEDFVIEGGDLFKKLTYKRSSFTNERKGASFIAPPLSKVSAPLNECTVTAPAMESRFR
jgi:hypothetical protein